ncbi:hypothetical protein ACFVVM_26200 [Nocardia sp. NPDC058176]|uniref:hypothetical protein n=1 Tax=Nocardia sp. NPDC058176 TaxID=3346368 RepID=UPI0036DCD82E
MDLVTKVSLTTELPISAELARSLAAKPELFAYVVRPYLRVPGMSIPEHIEPGALGSARLWLFGIVPLWTHRLRIVSLDEFEIYTNEHGGPLRVWNHRLTFAPLGPNSCRYTDEIEIEDGLHGLATRAFIHLMFRHRHRRWRALARVLA